MQKFLPSTPQFVVSQVIFAIDTIICGVRVEIFQVSPIFQQWLKLWGFRNQKVIWKTLIRNLLKKAAKAIIDTGNEKVLPQIFNFSIE